MATESVKILIEAEDKATAEMQKAVREQEKVAAKSAIVKQQQEQALNAERIAMEQGAEAAEAYKLTLQGLDAETAKLIAREKMLIQSQKQANAELAKQPGGLKSTKATTEFFGAVSGIAGGSQIAGLASQIAGLTEKTGQFSEIAKSGGAAALAFKGGLVAAAGVIGVQVGQALGSMIFQTEKWNSEVQKAIANSDRLASALSKVKDQDFSDEMSRIGFMDDSEASDALSQKLASVRKELTGVAAQAAKADKRFAELNSWTGAPWTFEIKTGLDLAVELADTQKEIERVAAEKDRLNDQAKQLERKIVIEVEFEQLQGEQQARQYLEGLQEQLKAVQSEAKGAKNDYEAFKNTSSAPQLSLKAVAVLDEIESTKKQIEEQQKLEQQQQQAAQKEAERAKQLAELRKGEIDKMREQAIALAEGKEAAHAFRLEQQGMSEFRAKEIAAEQAKLDELNETKNQKADKPTSLQAVESRLLSRGPEQDQTAKNTAEIARLAKEQLERLNKIAAKADKQVAEKTVELELISR